MLKTTSSSEIYFFFCCKIFFILSQGCGHIYYHFMKKMIIDIHLSFMLYKIRKKYMKFKKKYKSIWWQLYIRSINVFQFDPLMSLPVMSLQHIHIFADMSWLIMTIASTEILHVNRHSPAVSIFAILWHDDFG